MSELKTKATSSSVDAFLDSAGEQRRPDCDRLVEMMSRATGAAPVMWGQGTVGFGAYHYRYESGREGDWFLTGFSPRRPDLTLYIMAGFDRYDELMSRLGKYRTGKSCLYIKRLADIDTSVLEELVTASVAHMKRAYAPGASPT
jgi:hypothetical protein